MFTFTYLPQVAFCALFTGPLAFVAAIPLVLGESYAIISLVSKMFFVTQAQDDICESFHRDTWSTVLKMF
jgi:hypothetical protein